MTIKTTTTKNKKKVCVFNKQKNLNFKKELNTKRNIVYVKLNKILTHYKLQYFEQWFLDFFWFSKPGEVTTNLFGQNC